MIRLDGNLNQLVQGKKQGDLLKFKYVEYIVISTGGVTYLQLFCNALNDTAQLILFIRIHLGIVTKISTLNNRNQ